MMHSFSLQLDGFSEVEAEIADTFAKVFDDASVRTTVGVPYLDIDRESDLPLEDVMREAVKQVRALGYSVVGVSIDAAEKLNKELAK